MAAKLATAADDAFQRLHCEVVELLRSRRERQLALGLALLRIQQERLFSVAGHRSFQAYLRSLNGPSLRTMQRWIALAAKVPPAVARAVDPERLEPALRLLGAPGEAVPVTLKNLRALQVPVVRDGQPTTVPFDKATAEELVAAAAERNALPPLTERETQLVSALSESLARGSDRLGHARVWRRGDERMLVLEVPLGRAEELLARLGAELPYAAASISSTGSRLKPRRRATRSATT